VDSVLVNGTKVDSLASYTLINVTGDSSIAAYFSLNVVSPSIKVFLEGPYSRDSMSTALNRNGLIPLSQPYSAAPGVTVASIPSGVVDWILVELRTGTTAGTKVGCRAAFLKTDGSVVDTDGAISVDFPTLSPREYYIVIRHRNHLAVMSATAVALNASSTLYDFTTGLGQYYGADAKDLGGGKYGIYAGDGSGDGVIDSDDFNVTDNELFHSSYRKSDLNMDGFVDADDFNSTDNNLFKGTRVPN
jgi:hypothetical protein